MALAWNTLRALPRLRTYKDAAEWEANTKPIKGDKDKLKPVGKRNQKWRHIKRNEDGTITVSGGSQPLITFHADDTVEVYGPTYWNKATEHDMIREILGLEVWTERSISWVKCDGGKYKLRKGAGNLFKSETRVPGSYPVTVNVWTYLNPPKAITHVIDRKGAKAVRDRYAEFRRYLTAMCKLRRDNKPDFGEYMDAFPELRERLGANGYDLNASGYKPWWLLPSSPLHSGFGHEDAADLCRLMQSDKPEDQHSAMLWLMSRNWGGRAAFRAMDKCLMMHHHAEMLKTKEHEDGHKAIDRYLWAIPQKG